MTARLKKYSWEGDFFTVLVSSGQRTAGASRGAAVLFCYRFTKLFRECNPQSIKRQFADRFSEKWQTEVVLGCFFSSLVCIWELHYSKANWVLMMGQSDHKIFIMDPIGLFVPSCIFLHRAVRTAEEALCLTSKTIVLFCITAYMQDTPLCGLNIT